MKIKSSQLSSDSILNKDIKTFDYIDSFSGDFISERNINSIEIGRAFFTSGPKWVEKLFSLRNRIASLFGLKSSGKTTDRQKQLDAFKCESGERLGLFKVFSKTNNEVVLGEDDKHLNFRVSLLLDHSHSEPNKKNLTITTIVKFNNWLGRLYFAPVRLFHKVIVQQC